MAEKIRFKRQYKPVGFGDPPDPRTVEWKTHCRRSESRDAASQSYSRRL